MIYYNIRGVVELKSLLNEEQIVKRLAASLYSAGIDIALQGNKAAFEVPYSKSMSHWNAFGGMRAGLIGAEQIQSGVVNLEFSLATVRQFQYILLAFLLIVAMATIFLGLQDMIVMARSFSFPFIYAISIIGIGFFWERYSARWRFIAFVRNALSGEAEIVKQTPIKNKFNIRKTLIVSCLAAFCFALVWLGVFAFRKAADTEDAQPTVVWQYPIPGVAMSSPTISNGVLYFGRSKDVNGAAFYALDTKTGQEVWVKPLTDSVPWSPALTDDSVCFGTDDGYFYCLDKKTGEERWRFSPSQRNLDATNCDECALKLGPPVVEGNFVYVGSLDKHIYALDVRDGRLVWAFLMKDIGLGEPTIINGKVYATELGGTTYILNADTGVEINRFYPPSSFVGNDPSEIQATILNETTVLYEINGALAVMDHKMGTIVWRHPMTSDSQDHSASPPLVYENRVIVTTMKKVYAADITSGAVLWQFKNVKGELFFSPTLYQGVLYFGDTNGYLYAVDAKQGGQIFRYNMNKLDPSSANNYVAEFVFPAAVDQDAIYLNWFGRMYAIKRSTALNPP